MPRTRGNGILGPITGSQILEFGSGTTIKIEHVAIWTRDLERLKTFYEMYLGARAGLKYVNPTRQFHSYFLTWGSGARLELMSVPGLQESTDTQAVQRAGYAHLAFSVGSEQRVDELTARLKQDGYTVLSGPRRTGDGYYESSVLDPDGNRIEIAA